MNVLVLVGNLGQHPEIKYLESGTCLAEVSIAINTKKNGKQITSWYNCKVWGKAAETIANWCKKGDKIGLTGSLKYETWKDKATGKDRFSYVPTFYQVDLLGSKKDGDQGQPRPPAPQAEPVSVGGDPYKEIPFNRFGDELNWGA